MEEVTERWPGGPHVGMLPEANKQILQRKVGLTNEQVQDDLTKCIDSQAEVARQLNLVKLRKGFPKMQWVKERAC